MTPMEHVSEVENGEVTDGTHFSESPSIYSQAFYSIHFCTLLFHFSTKMHNFLAVNIKKYLEKQTTGDFLFFSKILDVKI